MRTLRHRPAQAAGVALLPAGSTPADKRPPLGIGGSR